MSGHTATLAEWAQMLSLSVSLYAAVSAPYFLLVDAEVWLWPRPLVAVREAAWSGRLDPLLQVVSHAKHDARCAAHAVREFARDAAALLILLTTSPKGALL